MTVLTTNSAIQYNGALGQDTFAYNFRVDNKEDMHVSLDGTEQVPSSWTITGLGSNAGGTVVLNTPLAAGAIVTLGRIIDATQEVDYQPFDAFPAETHEGALDKLTMLVQQNGSAVTRSVRFPFGDDSDPILPDAVTRQLKYFFFDENGDISLADGTVEEGDYVKTVAIRQDGSSGSPSMIGVDNLDLNNPKIFVQPTNVGTGLVQLVNAKIPNELLEVDTIRILGTFRADNECPKLVTDPGCVDPDYRNPTELLGGPYRNGDIYLTSYGELGDLSPPTFGDVNLLVDDETGVEQVVQVNVGDSLIYLEYLIHPNGHVVYEGWYLWVRSVQAGDAIDVAFNAVATEVIEPTSTNVDLALRDLDAQVFINEGAIQDNENAITGLDARVVINEGAIQDNENAITGLDARVVITEGLANGAVQRTGDQMSGALAIHFAALHNIPHINLTQADNANNLTYLLKLGSGASNPSVIEDDILLAFNKGAADTGVLVIGGWSTALCAIRIDNANKTLELAGKTVLTRPDTQLTIKSTNTSLSDILFQGSDDVTRARLRYNYSTEQFTLTMHDAAGATLNTFTLDQAGALHCNHVNVEFTPSAPSHVTRKDYVDDSNAGGTLPEIVDFNDEAYLVPKSFHQGIAATSTHSNGPATLAQGARYMLSVFRAAPANSVVGAVDLTQVIYGQDNNGETRMWFRPRQDATWFGWTEMASAGYANSLALTAINGSLSSQSFPSDDYDAVIKAGIYAGGVSSLNRPFDGTFNVQTYLVGADFCQLATQMGGDRIYYRAQTGAVWANPWKEIGTGGGAGVWQADTPPVDKGTFPIWFNTATGKTFTWYSDGDSSQWVQDVATSESIESPAKKNYIINPTFSINQRQFAGGATSAAYTFDRWTTNSNDISVSLPDVNGFITISGQDIDAKALIQRIEDFGFTGEVTLSWEGTAQASYYRASGGILPAYVSSPLTMTLLAGNNGGIKEEFYFGNGTLKNVKLEIGGVATPFEYPDIGTELAKCQRYFTTSYTEAYPIGGVVPNTYAYQTFWGSDASGGVASTPYFFPVTLRARPVITVWDLAGNEGKMTVANNTGTQTHNQAPNAIYLTQSHLLVRAYATPYFGNLFMFTADAEL